MRVRNSLLGGLTAAMVVGGALAAAPAYAATLVVDDRVGGGCNGTPATFFSIQAAVAAATSGDTIKVCPGNYTENVTVDKSVTLLGAQANVDARNRNTSSESRVDPVDAAATPTFNITASNVSLNGFLLTGNENNAAVQTSSTGAGYTIINNRIVANAIGIFFGANGDSPSVVKQNAIIANNENLGVAPAAGNGIYSDQGLSGALIQSNKFRNNVNAAVLVAGEAQGVTASGNNSAADGVFFAAYSGSGYRVINNTVALTNGSGIYFANAIGITVQQNRITGSSFSGIRLSDGVTAATIVGNIANGSGDQGISVSSTVPGAANVRSNTTNNNKGDGILFAAGTRSNIIRFNKASGNGNYDCQDLSSGSGTAHTANFWRYNTGATSNPAGLCKPPA